ncbi:hypothetical protein RQN30_09160 [Arcanobacterium hippocoleae]
MPAAAGKDGNKHDSNKYDGNKNGGNKQNNTPNAGKNGESLDDSESNIRKLCAWRKR